MSSHTSEVSSNWFSMQLLLRVNRAWPRKRFEMGFLNKLNFLNRKKSSSNLWLCDMFCWLIILSILWLYFRKLNPRHSFFLADITSPTHSLKFTIYKSRKHITLKSFGRLQIWINFITINKCQMAEIYFLWLNCQGQEHAGRVNLYFIPVIVTKGGKVWRKSEYFRRDLCIKSKWIDKLQRQKDVLIVSFISN